MPTGKNRGKSNRGRTAAGDDDDGLLFRRAMADARPLQRDTVEPPRRRSRPVARFSRQDERKVLRERLEASPHASETDSGSALSYRRPSVSLKTMRKLARGGTRVEGEVDLHGLTVARAKDALKDFIERSMRSGYTCVRIVHGKGLGSRNREPVLKGKVYQWLKLRDDVLAFSQAPAAHGGAGAALVLLKT